MLQLSHLRGLYNPALMHSFLVKPDKQIIINTRQTLKAVIILHIHQDTASFRPVDSGSRRRLAW